MDLINVKNDVNAETVETERLNFSMEQLRDLELCMVGGGMGDVQQ